MEEIRIGLVDDHSLFRKGVRSLLSNEQGFKVVIEAEGGESFLKKMSLLKSTEELPQIVLCDIKMDGMMGYELTATLKKKYPSIKVIALSMYSDEASVITMITNGACGYLLKGVDTWQLIQAIKAVHKEGVYLNEESGSSLLKKVHQADLYDIKDHEREFLFLCCSEMSYKQIAEQMGQSQRTIDGYRERLFPKINVRTRVGAVLFAFKQGIFKADE